MNFAETKALYERMHASIQRKATGKPTAFARFLGISEATLYRYLKQLREEYDAPIVYDTVAQRYEYSEDYELPF